MAGGLALTVICLVALAASSVTEEKVRFVFSMNRRTDNDGSCASATPSREPGTYGCGGTASEVGTNYLPTGPSLLENCGETIRGARQFLKSATPSHTSWTAMARIRKPKMRLIAPTAPGPRRRTSGPPIIRNR